MMAILYVTYPLVLFPQPYLNFFVTVVMNVKVSVDHVRTQRGMLQRKLV